MRLKVLITGNNKKIAKDLCEHIEADRGYDIIKCHVSKSALFEQVLKEVPHIVIICAGDETHESVEVFDVLKDAAIKGVLDVIVVANDDDRKYFMSVSKLPRIFFLARPVSLTVLYRQFGDLERKYEKNENNAIMEYVNPNAEEISQINFKRKRILVVDDDPEQLMMIKEHLNEFYDVTLVNSGNAALKFLTKHKVELVLLDYMMPDMNGPEVLVRLREDPTIEDCSVVFLSGMSDKKAVITTLAELKPQGYILKPAKKSELVAKIIDVLG